MTEAQLIHKGWALWHKRISTPMDIYWIDADMLIRRMSGFELS